MPKKRYMGLYTYPFYIYYCGMGNGKGRQRRNEGEGAKYTIEGGDPQDFSQMKQNRRA